MLGGAGWSVRNAGEPEPESTALRTHQVLLGNYRGGRPTATDLQGSDTFTLHACPGTATDISLPLSDSMK